MREHVRLLGHLTPVPVCALCEGRDATNKERHVCARRRDGEPAVSSSGPTLTAPRLLRVRAVREHKSMTAALLTLLRPIYSPKGSYRMGGRVLHYDNV